DREGVSVRWCRSRRQPGEKRCRRHRCFRKKNRSAAPATRAAARCRRATAPIARGTSTGLLPRPGRSPNASRRTNPCRRGSPSASPSGNRETGSDPSPEGSLAASALPGGRRWAASGSNGRWPVGGAGAGVRRGGQGTSAGGTARSWKSNLRKKTGRCCQPVPSAVAGAAAKQNGPSRGRRSDGEKKQIKTEEEKHHPRAKKKTKI